MLRDDAPLLNHVKGAEHPVLRMPVGERWIAAPTAAFIYQFREWCLLERRHARGALRPAGVRVEVTVHAALRGLTVLERGWLSSNNIVIHAAAGEPGAVLVDTGHVMHAEQTVALVRHALRGEPLHRIVNTHLHSDHCGGNAALQRAFGAPITVPPGNADAVASWDTMRLTHATTGQRSERFTHADTLSPGRTSSPAVGAGMRWPRPATTRFR